MRNFETPPSIFRHTRAQQKARRIGPLHRFRVNIDDGSSKAVWCCEVSVNTAVQRPPFSLREEKIKLEFISCEVILTILLIFDFIT